MNPYSETQMRYHVEIRQDRGGVPCAMLNCPSLAGENGTFCDTHWKPGMTCQRDAPDELAKASRVRAYKNKKKPL